MPGIYLEKTPPPSPTIASFQHLVIRRHRSLFLACCMLLAITSLYTLFAVGSIATSSISPLQKDHELRPITLRKGEHGRVRSLIPQKIWQIMLPKGGKGVDMWNVDPEQLKETNSWLAKNIDYQYQLVGPRRADAFVEANFADNERLLNAYHNLTNMGMKSDLLRYLLLHVEGGVYSDIDTVAIRPVDAWIPRNMRDRVKLVVGIEFDKRDGPNWGDILHDLQFCQWTIAAAPGHPVFMKMVDRILDSLDEMSATHGVPVSEIVPSSTEVMNSTGPAAWTDIVFETLQGFDPTLNETKDLSFMDQATLLGDILVLTIDGFGMGQQHSASTNDGSTPSSALIKHQFWGSWREPPSEEELQKQEAEKKAEEETRKEAEQSKAESEEAKTQNEEEMRQKAEAQRLADEALRMQEAKRLGEEAERMRVGAEKLKEEAERQRIEALQAMEAARKDKENAETTPESSPAASPPVDTQPDSTPAAALEATEQVRPAAAEELQPSASPAANIPLIQASPAPQAVVEEKQNSEAEDEVLAVDTSAPPVVRISKEEEDFNADEDEVLVVDTSAPPWPSEEWAP